MKRLTFDGINDLYQTEFGALTLVDAARMRATQQNYHRAEASQHAIKVKPVVVSDELELRNERHIDEHGCGMY